MADRQRESGIVRRGCGEHHHHGRLHPAAAHFCQTRQVDQGQIEYVWAVDLEVNWKLGDALVLSCHPVRLILDLLSDFSKVRESLVQVQKFSVLCPGRKRGGVALPRRARGRRTCGG